MEIVMDREIIKKKKTETEEFQKHISWLVEQVGASTDAVDYLIDFLDIATAGKMDENSKKAKELYEKIWIKIGSNSKIKRALTELEIKKILENQDKILQVSTKLSLILRDLKACNKILNEAQEKVKILGQTWDLIQDVKEMKQMSAANGSAKQCVQDMLKAKESMNKIMAVVKTLTPANEIPVVGDFIGFYLDFFEKTDSVCNKVADYANTIISETDKALGTKGTLTKAFNDDNNLFGKTRRALNDDDFLIDRNSKK